MSRTLPQPKIPKHESIMPKGETPKSRHRIQIPKIGVKPPKVAKIRPPKPSVSMVKPQRTKVTPTFRSAPKLRPR
jgi:hypothetical protein